MVSKRTKQVAAGAGTVASLVLVHKSGAVTHLGDVLVRETVKGFKATNELRGDIREAQALVRKDKLESPAVGGLADVNWTLAEMRDFMKQGKIPRSNAKAWWDVMRDSEIPFQSYDAEGIDKLIKELRDELDRVRKYPVARAHFRMKMNRYRKVLDKAYDASGYGRRMFPHF